MPDDRDLLSYRSESPDEHTVIASRPDTRALREPKDRHLLVRLSGAQLGRVIRLSAEPCLLGRAPECTIWVGDEGVSRKHAVVLFEDGHYVVEDAGSANGTFVGGRRIERQLLTDGDVLQLGPGTLFRYTLTDASQEALLRKLFEASVTDPLTGVHNRIHFDVQLRAELSFARRHRNDVALVLFDIDHFKRVNDTFGHPVGDRVLIEIAQALHKMVRREDILARYGGEEFGFILRGIDPVGAHAMGERLRTTVENLEFTTDAGSLRVTVSVGCACMAGNWEVSAEELIATADRRLYAAKHGGRNRVVSSD